MRTMALPSRANPFEMPLEFDPHLRTASLFGMMKKFREFRFLPPRYHCERSQSGRG
jgi:hypothetical protein